MILVIKLWGTETKNPGAGLLPGFAVRTGLEPATSCVTGRHSNQLNYRTILVLQVTCLICECKVTTFFYPTKIFAKKVDKKRSFCSKAGRNRFRIVVLTLEVCRAACRFPLAVRAKCWLAPLRCVLFGVGTCTAGSARCHHLWRMGACRRGALCGR